MNDEGEKLDSYLLRLPSEMREKIRTAAKSERRSMNSQIIVLLQQALSADTKQGEAA